jgi:hypothetical protein
VKNKPRRPKMKIKEIMLLALLVMSVTVDVAAQTAEEVTRPITR